MVPVILGNHNDIRKNKELWDLFTGRDEYNQTTLDEHQRCTFSCSGKKEILHPPVSEYLLAQGYKFNYPEDKSWVLLLTHDIDDVYVSSKHLLLSLLHFPKNGDLKGIYNLTKGRLNKRYSPYKNFKDIVSIEQDYNATSTFFFLSSPEDIYGHRYRLEDIEDVLGYLHDKHCEIGFHTGYYHYDDVERIKKEKMYMERLIGEPLIGARNHVLRFRTPQSWEILAAAGFGYDSTYGYIDMVGFRNGMCHPFIPYNVETQQPINILEIPLNIQDWTLHHYMKKNPQSAWKLIEQILITVMKNQGVLNILWHNWTFSLPTSVGNIFDKEWTRLYKKILTFAYENNAWITNCKQFYDYFHKHGFIVKK